MSLIDDVRRASRPIEEAGLKVTHLSIGLEEAREFYHSPFGDPYAPRVREGMFMGVPFVVEGSRGVVAVGVMP